jgi:hypothetical protein
MLLVNLPKEKVLAEVDARRAQLGRARSGTHRFRRPLYMALATRKGAGSNRPGP